MSNYIPPIAIHPGETLLEFLEGETMTQVQLANRTGLTTKTINGIVKGKNPISHETALKLSIVFKTSASFWNNLQRSYDETITRIALEKEIEDKLAIAQKFTCYPELVKYKYIENSPKIEQKALSLLKFLGVTSFDYLEKSYHVAYRKSQTDKLSKENLIAWLRCGEIEAEKIEKPFKSFNKDKLRKTLPKLRKLTMKEPDTYSKEFFSLLFMCGIILVYVPYLKNTFVNGAVRWLNSGNPLIQIAPRFKREDALLFTIFHEIGHIIKHGKGVGYINLEKAKRSCLSQESVMAEQEADNFALNTLIKKSDWTNFIKNKSFSPRTIKEFANEIKISKSVVAGRLAFELNNYARFQHLFKKIDLKRNL